ncbi:hypothetical protein [Iningainema tapete]|uniref:hypothetical protein n=1 Tax=Iningainema tapete TaxID=2806730 RepID=UPI00192DEB60|nr:hypothetical protein [Iningainema tapete]
MSGVNAVLEFQTAWVVANLINNVNGVVSTQVINEVCSVLCRKASFTAMAN